MVTVTMTIEEYEALMDLVRSANGDITSLMTSAPDVEMPGPKPKKRKRSRYQKELGRQLKMLKKKHPRTKVTALMKKAHRATRKVLKK